VPGATPYVGRRCPHNHSVPSGRGHVRPSHRWSPVAHWVRPQVGPRILAHRFGPMPLSDGLVLGGIDASRTLFAEGVPSGSTRSVSAHVPRRGPLWVETVSVSTLSPEGSPAGVDTAVSAHVPRRGPLWVETVSVSTLSPEGSPAGVDTAVSAHVPRRCTHSGRDSQCQHTVRRGSRWGRHGQGQQRGLRKEGPLWGKARALQLMASARSKVLLVPPASAWTRMK
jgi:hypothetical protein